MTKKILAVLIPLSLCIAGVLVGRYMGWIYPARTPPSQSIDEIFPQAQQVPWKLEVVAEHLFVPWSIIFTEPTRMLVAERNGNVRVIQDGVLQEKPLHTFSLVRTRQEEGLMGMAVDPGYTTNHFVYFCYAVPSGKAYTDKVVRMTDQGDKLTDEVVLIDTIPAAQFHAGCRIKFGPDGKLYVTTGDATNKKNPQDLTSLGGKMLRINRDGSIPDDNPFPHSPVWTYGHRNAQGFDWDPATGTLIATEHGPSLIDGPAGGDEVNIIERGKNYGWPIVSHEKHQEGMVDPLLLFTPAIAPADGIFYTGDMFPQWKNHFLFAMLKGEGIMDVTFDPNDSHRVTSYQKLAEVAVGRVREIVQAPDGSILFATSNEDGRGNARDGDDRIYRIRADSAGE